MWADGTKAACANMHISRVMQNCDLVNACEVCASKTQQANQGAKSQGYKMQACEVMADLTAWPSWAKPLLEFQGVS